MSDRLREYYGAAGIEGSEPDPASDEGRSKRRPIVFQSGRLNQITDNARFRLARIAGTMTLFPSFGLSIFDFDFSFFHLNSRRHKLGAYEYRRHHHRQ